MIVIKDDPLIPAGDVTSDWVTDPWDDPSRAVVEDDVDVSITPHWRHFLRLAAVTAVSLVIVCGAAGFWLVHQLNPGGVATSPVNFTVNEGDSIATIAKRLDAQGIIVNSTVFRWYADYKNLTVTPGYYAIKPHDTASNIVDILSTPPSETFTSLTFPEGYTVAQIADRVASKSVAISAAEVLSAATNGSVTSSYLPAGSTNLEGVLFPDTYQISGNDNATKILQRMASLMERVGKEENLDGAKSVVGYEPYQVLIVASMIEREAKTDADRPLIARVIYNRLAAKMKLEIDATLLYNADPNTAFTDLKALDTPYNTYVKRGLPPTPIANPGRASIRAALAPAANPKSSDAVCANVAPGTKCQYLYYVIKNAQGEHEFAATYEDHLVNVEKARQAGLLK